MSANKWVYLFTEVDAAQEQVGGDWDAVRSLMGGKGANLAEMTRLGLPVPPGFTVTTEACNAYLEADEQFPEGAWEQAVEAMSALEAATGKNFGDAENPLLVSCRSGAKFSMPGMMDTVLNIGLNDEVAQGMVRLTSDPRFVYDSYRRVIHMFGSVVMGIDDEKFEEVLERARERAGVQRESDLGADDWKAVVEDFKGIYADATGEPFPQDPRDQVRRATEAVFKSWNGKRAIDYRNATKIAHDLGTGVNIQTMVFGNLGDDSASGVAVTRSATSGERRIEGDYLTNAQGEDVVAGTRITEKVEDLGQEMSEAYATLSEISETLEQHFREMQDIEFTVERGKLWMLQTRDGKRTAQSAVRIAVEMADEGLITKEEAVLKVSPEQVDFFLHPQFDNTAKRAAKDEGRYLATGLDVSPGAAVGQVAFTADLAEEWTNDGREVIMVRPETKPDDVHGILAAKGVLTSRGGRTSHAALVARQFGRPAVVGVAALDIDRRVGRMTVDDTVVEEGDWISIDGTTGEVFAGKIGTVIPDIEDEHLIRLLGWADEVRRLEIWVNADYPKDAVLARKFGAQGIGLCRTEHMFFETTRLPYVQKMILTNDEDERAAALAALLPFQREDFAGLFRAMDGLPVIIRLIDPPLHEFLPAERDLVTEILELKHAGGDAAVIAEKETLLAAVERLHESNPMLGLRGVRLGIHLSALTRMQVRAIFEAACEVAKEGVDVHPEIMIPLTSHANELKVQRAALEDEGKQVMTEQGIEVNYKFGTMIEIPRAALTADEMAEYAEFFSYGTNDLTQTTFGISRDDAEKGFLIEYIERGILPENPFASIDQDGVGALMKTGVELGRKTRPGMSIGICGEHGGDPKSVAFCHTIGLDYVSCSTFRVPIARLAAAQVVLRERS